MQDDYRGEARRVIKDSHWTFWKILPLVLVVLAVMVVLGWALQAAGIIDMNIQREVTQQSQQYTESQQARLQNLYTEYTSLQTAAATARANNQDEVLQAVEAQQMALIAQMRRITTNIPSSEVPEEVRTLLDRAR